MTLTTFEVRPTPDGHAVYRRLPARHACAEPILFHLDDYPDEETARAVCRELETLYLALAAHVLD